MWQQYPGLSEDSGPSTSALHHHPSTQPPPQQPPPPHTQPQQQQQPELDMLQMLDQSSHSNFDINMFNTNFEWWYNSNVQINGDGGSGREMVSTPTTSTTAATIIMSKQSS